MDRTKHSFTHFQKKGGKLNKLFDFSPASPCGFMCVLLVKLKNNPEIKWKLLRHEYELLLFMVFDITKLHNTLLIGC